MLCGRTHCPGPLLHSIFPPDKEQGAGRERALAVGCPRRPVLEIRAVTAEGVGLEAGGARTGSAGQAAVHVCDSNVRR